ncbi:MAG: glycosyltransferase family 2 protein [Planctomycetes bacterium]|nr:glycosyltransferase family 2 protein [Planctomycetota bacterium]
MNSAVVSILVVSWNTREVLRDCLRTVHEQTRQTAFEVIVVDNASTDGSVEMIRTEFPQVRLLANASNRGFAAANNQGIKVAQGRYVLLLNSDTLVLDGAIDKTIAFAEAHAEAAAVACRVLNPDRTWQPTCFMFPSALNLLIGALYLNKVFPRSRFWGRERMTWWDGLDTREVDVVTGCFILVRREAIEQVGVLDESYFMYGEEADWCYRFHQAGGKVLFTPGAQIVHLGGVSSAQRKGPMCLQLRASLLLFLRKHRGRASYSAGCAFVSLFFLLRLPLWLATAAAARGAGAENWEMVRTYAAGFWRALYGWKALRVREQAKAPACP